MNIQAIEGNFRFRSDTDRFLVESLYAAGLTNLATYIETLQTERNESVREATEAKDELDTVETRLQGWIDDCDRLTDQKEKLIEALEIAAKRIAKLEKAS